MDHVTSAAGQGLVAPRPVSERRWAALAVLLAVLAGTIVRVGLLADVKQRTPDEVTYTAQANALRLAGVDGLRALAAQYIADPQRALPSPTRVGYTAPTALLMAITQRSDAQVGAWLSTLAGAASVALLGWIAWQCCGWRVAAMACLFYAFYAPALVVSRRAWADAWTECLTLAAIGLTAFLLRRDTSGKAQRAALIGMVVTVFALILSKEISLVVILLLVAAVAAWQWPLRSSGRGVNAQAARYVIAVGVAASLAAMTLAWCVGSWATLWNIVGSVGHHHSLNPYTVEYQSGPWWWLTWGVAVVNPVVCGLALVACLSVARVVWRRAPGGVRAVSTPERQMRWFALYAVVFLCLPLMLSGWLNLRFFSPAYGVMCLLAAWAMERIIVRIQASHRVPRVVVWGLPVVVLVAASLHQVRYVQRVFVEGQTADLSIKMVLAGANAASAAPARPGAGADTPPGSTEAMRQQQAVVALNESLTHYQNRRFEACIVAARRALALNPGLAEAHNNIAAAHAELAQWQAAVDAAQEALRIKPDFQLAKNNLAWASYELAKQRAKP